jgi:serine/threonine protein kinase
MHQNIIGLRAFSHDASNYYLVMELARGQELYDRLVSKGMLTQPQVRCMHN